MEKFGVDVDASISKEASDGKKKVCPHCGKPLLVEDANVPRCPTCGTQHFEAK